MEKSCIWNSCKLIFKEGILSKNENLICVGGKRKEKRWPSSPLLCCTSPTHDRYERWWCSLGIGCATCCLGCTRASLVGGIRRSGNLARGDHLLDLSNIGSSDVAVGPAERGEIFLSNVISHCLKNRKLVPQIAPAWPFPSLVFWGMYL